MTNAERQRRWVAENKEKSRAYQATYRAKNKERIKELARRWYIENKGQPKRQKITEHWSAGLDYPLLCPRLIPPGFLQSWVQGRGYVLKKKYGHIIRHDILPEYKPKVTNRTMDEVLPVEAEEIVAEDAPVEAENAPVEAVEAEVEETAVEEEAAPTEAE